MNQTILIQGVNLDDFYEKIRKTVAEELAFQKSCVEVVNNNFLTRKETATRLRITLPTLNEYTKNGVLKGQRIGYRVLYKEEDVTAAIKEIPNRKYRRGLSC